MKTIVLLTNILTPYRRHFYDLVYKTAKSKGVSFYVLVMTDTSMNGNWHYNEYKTDYTILMPGKKVKFLNQILLFNPTVNKYIKNLSPSLIIVAGSYMFPTNWQVLIKYNHKIPILYWNEAHNNEKRKYNKFILKLRNYIRYNFFSRIDGYFYSGKLALDFMKEYSPLAKSYFLPNLIDESKYFAVKSISDEEKRIIKEKYKINEDRKILICPARLTYVKGIHTFIKLLDKCYYRDKFTLLIPGNGNMEIEIKQLIKLTQLDIRLLGFKNQDEMLKLYAISDIFVMPSLSDPNPLTSIEALWCGLPLLVSTHVGNYPEVVKPGINGYVFDYSNENQAIQYIDTIINASTSWMIKAKNESLLIAHLIYNSKNVVNRLVNSLYNDFFV